MVISLEHWSKNIIYETWGAFSCFPNLERDITIDMLDYIVKKFAQLHATTDIAFVLFETLTLEFLSWNAYRKTFNCTRGYYSFLKPLGAGIIQGRLLIKGGYNCTILKYYPKK